MNLPFRIDNGDERPYSRSGSGPRFRISHALAPSCALLALALCAACTPTKTVTVEYTVEQTGLVPAPQGPHAKGAMVEDGKIALEGSYSGSSVFTEGRSRYQGAKGNLVVNHTLGGRFAAGIGNVELGLDLEYANAAWATAVSSDADDSELNNQSMFRFGPQVRGLFVGDRKRGFGGLFEFSAGNVPYQRSVWERRYLTTWSYQGDPEWWKTPLGKTSLLGERSRHKKGNLWYFFARIGLYGTFDVVEGVNVTVGMLAQNVPDFFGVEVLSESCTAYADYPTTCVGSNPDDLDEYETEWLGSVFASVSWQLGMVTLIGQLHGHPVASDYGVVEASPFGGDLAVRLSF